MSELQLIYAFLPDPNPIRASVKGSDPGLIDLQVMVSTPADRRVNIAKIVIEIPVGRDDSGYLSAAASLPAPEYDSPGWEITSSGSSVIITPISGSNGLLVGTILFTLGGIAVADYAGTVQLTIVEHPGDLTDSTTYKLVKWPSDFVVTRFYARPSALNNLDQTAVIYWACTQQGSSFAYQIRSPDWEPRQCVDDGDCFTVMDGESGVETPELTQTTVFDLDVVKSTSAGGRIVIATLQTTVSVLVPSISPDSRMFLMPNSRIACLHWLTFESSRCSVQLDGTVVDHNAVPDTYARGYTTILNEPMGTLHQFSLIAHAATGSAQASFVFPEFMVQDRSKTLPLHGAGPVNSPLSVVQFSSDSSLALIAGDPANRLLWIDAHDPTNQGSIALPGSGDSSAQADVACVPGSNLALVTNSIANFVTVVDLGNRTADPNPIPVGQSPSAIAITPDSRLALVANWDSRDVSVIDLKSHTTETTTISIPDQPKAIAIAPDGKTALVLTPATTKSGPGYLHFVEIPGRKVTASIQVDTWAQQVLVTPDGTLALVLNTSGSITVVDMKDHRAEPNPIVTVTHPIIDQPHGMAVFPDGKYALVGVSGLSSTMIIAVVDIPGRKLDPLSFRSGLGPNSVAIAPNGSVAAVLNRDNTITVL